MKKIFKCDVCERLVFLAFVNGKEVLCEDDTKIFVEPHTCENE